VRMVDSRPDSPICLLSNTRKRHPSFFALMPRLLGLLQQRISGELPTGSVWRAVEATREMCRGILGPIEMRAITASLAMKKQPAA
jgi:hypothetical protein